MAISFDKVAVSGSVPAFWRGESKVLPGDFKLTQTFDAGTLIKRGTPIYVDFVNMQATICKSVKIVAGGTTSAPRVVKGSLVAVGDTLTIGGNSQAITAIDKTASDYDVITFGSALTGATSGAFAVVGASVPNAVVEETYEYQPVLSFQTVAAAYEALVLSDVVYPVPTDWLTGFCLKNNPSIKYIRQ